MADSTQMLTSALVLGTVVERTTAHLWISTRSETVESSSVSEKLKDALQENLLQLPPVDMQLL
jgi:hypothetical protein